MSWIDTPLGLPTGGLSGQMVLSNGLGSSYWLNPGGPGQMLQANALGEVSWSLYNFPATIGTSGDVLTSDGTDIIWTKAGDVIAPVTNADQTLALWSGTNSKTLQQTSYSLPLGDGSPNRFLQTNGSNVVSWSNFSLPDVTGTIGQVLTTAGDGNTSWTDAGSGDVVGPLSSTPNAIALYDGLTGKLLKDSPMTFATGILTVPTQVNTQTLAITGSSSGVVNITGPADITDYSLTFPDAAPISNNQLLQATTGGVLTWTDAPTGVPSNNTAGQVLLSDGTNGSNWIPTGTTGTFLTVDGLGLPIWSAFSFPSAGGGSGEVLVADGSGGTNWSTTGSGDVSGPGAAVGGNNVVVWDGATGTDIKDSGTDFDVLVKGPATSVANNIPIFSNGDGDIADSTIPISSIGDVKGPGPVPGTIADRIALYSDGSGTLLKESNWTVPLGAGTPGQVLTYSAPGATTWASTGDVSGPGSSNNNEIAVFDLGTGKVIKSSGILYTDINVSDANVVGPLVATDANRIALYQDNLGTQLTQTIYSIPTAVGLDGQVLMANSAGNVVWSNTGAGDVVGPPTSTPDAVAIYNGATGNLLKDSTMTFTGGILTVPTQVNANTFSVLGGSGAVNITGPATITPYALTLPDAAPISNGQLLQGTTGGVLSWTDAPAGVPTNSTAGQVLLSDGTNGSSWLTTGATGRFLTSDGSGSIWSQFGFPNTQGTSGEVLISDGIGGTTWGATGSGDVTGPGSAVGDQNIVIFNGTSGTDIEDSTINISEIIKGPGAGTSVDRIALYSDATGTLLKESNFTVPVGAGTPGQVLTVQAPGSTEWTEVGDVRGPGTSNSNIDNIATFSDVDGNIKDSTISINDINTSDADVKGPGSSTTNAIPLYKDTTGTELLNSTLTFDGTTLAGASSLTLKDSGANNISIQAPSSISSSYNLVLPAATPTPNQILEWDGSGNLVWTNTPTGTGDVSSSGSFAINGVAVYKDSLGKEIISTSYSIPTGNGTGGQVLTTNGGGAATWEDPAGGDVKGPSASIDNRIATFLGTGGDEIQDSGKLLSDYAESPGPSIIDNIATFSNVNGDIKDSLIPIASLGDVKGPGTNAANTIAAWGALDSKILQDTGILFSDINTSGANVVGPPGATPDAVALYSGSSGTLLKDSPMTFTGGILTVPTQVNAQTFSVNGSSSGNVNITGPADITNYSLTLPDAAPTVNNQILQGTTSGVLSWTDPPAGVPTNSTQAGQVLLSNASNGSDWLIPGITGRFTTADGTGAST